MITEFEIKMKPGKYITTSKYAYINYNGILIDSKLNKNNYTVCITSKNRKDNFIRLSNTLNIDCPKILLTQDECYNIPNWEEYNITENNILPAYNYMTRYNINKDHCSTKNSLSWARNEVMSKTKTEWIICFDDDFTVKEDWLDYYIDVQNHSMSSCVMNNFGAFVLHYPTMRKYVYGIDERYINGSSGCEDEDFFARWIESGLNMVIGFNKEHTFDSSIRGSSTGYDSFIHHRSKTGGCRTTDYMNFNNQIWHWDKWSLTNENTGIQTRPPFKGWVKRNIQEEIDWIGDFH